MQEYKVLYIHEIASGPGSFKQKCLEKAIGPCNVYAPNLNTRRKLTVLATLYTLLVAVAVTSTPLAFIFVNTSVGVALASITAVVILLGFFVVGKAITSLLLAQSVSAAEKAYRELNPNVLVASGFGAIVALTMNTPKLPMILLAPSQYQYHFYFGLKPLLTLQSVPYALIIHGSDDIIVPVADSIRLVETAEKNRCRLEIVKDTNRLSTLTPQQWAEWLDEVSEKCALEKQSSAASQSSVSPDGSHAIMISPGDTSTII